MKISPRVTSLAATVGMAAMLSAPVPALASDGGDGSATQQQRHRAHAHIVTYRAARQALAPMPANLACSYYGVWCGRQFVLIVGIAY
jgi:hypothetical protein